MCVAREKRHGTDGRVWTGAGGYSPGILMTAYTANGDTRRRSHSDRSRVPGTRPHESQAHCGLRAEMCAETRGRRRASVDGMGAQKRRFIETEDERRCVVMCSVFCVLCLWDGMASGLERSGDVLADRWSHLWSRAWC